jgi:hypothetical protein
MPNHVSSQMTLKGDPATIREFYEAHTSRYHDGEGCYLDFNTIIPMPAALDCTAHFGDLSDTQQDNQRKYGYTDWYGWRRDHWGTKWNAYNCEIELHDPTVTGVGKGNDIALPTAELYVEFQTAWSLPEAVLNEIVNLYPELDMLLECVEEGGFFAGYIKYSNGEAEVRLEEGLWKEYVGDCHEDGMCNEDGTVWFNDDGTIEPEFTPSN